MARTMEPMTIASNHVKKSFKPVIKAVEPLTARIEEEDKFALGKAGEDFDELMLDAKDFLRHSASAASSALEDKKFKVKNHLAKKLALFHLFKLRKGSLLRKTKSILLAPFVVIRTKALGIKLAKIALAKNVAEKKIRTVQGLKSFFKAKVNSLEEELSQIDSVFANAKEKIEILAEKKRQELTFIIQKILSKKHKKVNKELEKFEGKGAKFEQDVLTIVGTAQEDMNVVRHNLESEFDPDEFVLVSEHIDNVSIDLVKFSKIKIEELDIIVKAELSAALEDEFQNSIPVLNINRMDTVESLDFIEQESNLEISDEKIDEFGGQDDLEIVEEIDVDEENFRKMNVDPEDEELETVQEIDVDEENLRENNFRRPKVHLEPENEEVERVEEIDEENIPQLPENIEEDVEDVLEINEEPVFLEENDPEQVSEIEDVENVPIEEEQ